MVKSICLAPALMLVAASALAAGKPPAKHPVAVQKPDPALLEFLGTWESPDGHWVDPMTFAKTDPDKLRQEKARRDGKLSPAVDKPASKNSGGSGV